MVDDIKADVFQYRQLLVILNFKSAGSNLAMSLSDVPFAHFLPHTHNHYFPDYHDLSAANSIYQDPTFHSPAPVLSHGVSSHFSTSVKSRSAAKSAFKMNTLSTEEMERFQKLSNEFEPDVQVRGAWKDSA